MNTLFVFFLLILLHSAVIAEEEPIVEIPNGKIKGNFQQSYDNRIFTAFEGIPYGKPPLRFQDPEPAEKWDGILIANKRYMCPFFSPIPTMYGLKGQEDCLYVYVYVPRKQIKIGENLPVVVHIHGGAFMFGSPSINALPDYIMDEDLIFVAMNYRMGTLGFLSTGDSASPGNYGLKDQSLALKWIKDNIKYFGGDPNSITLTGQSAGACSVDFHYLSPMSKGLFSRGLAASGSTLSSWSINDNPLKYAKLAASYINCTTEDNQKMIDCMKGKDLKELVVSYKGAMIVGGILPLAPFGPVVDNDFLPDHPFKLWSEGKAYDVPMVRSTVTEEGVLFSGLLTLGGKIATLDKEWSLYAPYLLNYADIIPEDKLDETSKKIKEHYFKRKHISSRTIDNLSKLLTDRHYLMAEQNMLRIFATTYKSPIYYGTMDYIIQQPFLLPVKQKPTHADDLRLYIKTLLNPSKLKPNDEKMKKLFTQYIYEYALKGVPKFGNVEWKPVKAGAKEIDYMLIGSPTNFTMTSTKLLSPHIPFWEKLIPIEKN